MTPVDFEESISKTQWEILGLGLGGWSWLGGGGMSGFVVDWGVFVLNRPQLGTRQVVVVRVINWSIRVAIMLDVCLMKAIKQNRASSARN